MFDKLKGAAGSVTSKAANLKDAGIDALQSTVDELNVTLPRLNDVGYSVTRVEVEIGLSPKIILTVARVFDADAAAFATLLSENADKKVFCTILGALQQANQLQQKIHFQRRHFKELEIELGIPPAVRMAFLEEERPRTAPRMEEEPTPPEEPPPRTHHEEDPEAEQTAIPPPPEPEPEADEEPPAVPPPPAEWGDEWLPLWCAGCVKYFRVSKDKAGLVARCRRCGTTLRVPVVESGS